MNRRALLHTAVLSSSLLLASGLTGCGFALRQSQPMAFRTIALNGFAGNSPMAVELARALEAQGVAVVESSAQAVARAGDLPAGAAPLSGHVILEAQADQRDQAVATTTAFGQVRDMSLRTRLKFRLLRADGSELLPVTDLLLTRDLPYNEKDALARQDEFEQTHRAMQSDLVSQVLRRLAAARP
jgi:LPS-assembly lipoprotein